MLLIFITLNTLQTQSTDTFKCKSLYPSKKKMQQRTYIYIFFICTPLIKNNNNKKHSVQTHRFNVSHPFDNDLNHITSETDIYSSV